MANWLKYAAIGGALAGAATAGVLEETLAVPSGYAVQLQEKRVDQLPDGAQVLRLRFVMPAIARPDHVYSDVAGDFEALCNHLAWRVVGAQSKDIDHIVVSLSDRETDFGVSNSDATQYFEAFTLETDICIWEGF
ncbi:DUF6497 family protein [Cognatishimia sp. WU-CL00825]|uniref:DUF6497 family protein n=1 Tax=Cognatishimia sp. WU-CL00825 TaxID=3127658 RepID=UPI00310464D1